jgi:hypothetical protein
MNRTIQEATVNKYFYKDYDELNEHLLCLYAENSKKCLTPYEFVVQSEPSRFVANPHHLSPGPYS